MGTAGLNVKRLKGLLQQQKVDSVLLEEDESQDHVVLELSSVRRPNQVARLEYENKGFEPRLALLTVSPATVETAELSPDTRMIQISGNRDDDVKKIVQFVRETFLEQ
jgi:hypothetical protein